MPIFRPLATWFAVGAVTTQLQESGLTTTRQSGFAETGLIGTPVVASDSRAQPLAFLMQFARLEAGSQNRKGQGVQDSSSNKSLPHAQNRGLNEAV